MPGEFIITLDDMDNLETQKRLRFRQRTPLRPQPGCEDQGGGSTLGQSRRVRPSSALTSNLGCTLISVIPCNHLLRGM